MKAFFLSFLILVGSVFCNTVVFAQTQPQQNNTIPSLEMLRSLIGEEESSTNLLSFKAKYGLRLYSRREDVKMTEKVNRYQVHTKIQYGGNGFIVTLGSSGNKDILTGKYFLPTAAKVYSTSIICGTCDEERELGRWKGDMPPIGVIPTNSQAILVRHRNPDDNFKDVHYEGRFCVRSRQYIKFGGPTPENCDFPYAFIFDDDHLSQITILKSNPGKLIPFADQ